MIRNKGLYTKQNILDDFSDGSDDDYGTPPISNDYNDLSSNTSDDNTQIYRNMQAIPNVKTFQPPIRKINADRPCVIRAGKSSNRKGFNSNMETNAQNHFEPVPNKAHYVSSINLIQSNNKQLAVNNANPRNTYYLREKAPKSGINRPTNINSDYDTESTVCNMTSKQPQRATRNRKTVQNDNKKTNPIESESGPSKEIKQSFPQQNLNESVLDSFLKRFDSEFDVNPIVTKDKNVQSTSEINSTPSVPAKNVYKNSSNNCNKQDTLVNTNLQEDVDEKEDTSTFETNNIPSVSAKKYSYNCNRKRDSVQNTNLLNVEKVGTSGFESNNIPSVPAKKYSYNCNRKRDSVRNTNLQEDVETENTSAFEINSRPSVSAKEYSTYNCNSKLDSVRNTNMQEDVEIEHTSAFETNNIHSVSAKKYSSYNWNRKRDSLRNTNLQDVEKEDKSTFEKRIHDHTQFKKPRIDLQTFSFPVNGRQSYMQETDNESDISNLSQVTTRCGRVSRSPSVYIQATMVGNKRVIKSEQKLALERSRRASSYTSDCESLGVTPFKASEASSKRVQNLQSNSLKSLSRNNDKFTAVNCTPQKNKKNMHYRKMQLFKSPEVVENNYISEATVDADSEHSVDEYDHNRYSRKTKKLGKHIRNTHSDDLLFKKPMNINTHRIFRENKSPPDDNHVIEKENKYGNNTKVTTKSTSKSITPLQQDPKDKLIVHSNLKINSITSALPLSPFSNKSHQKPVECVKPSLQSSENYENNSDNSRASSFINLSSGNDFGESFYDDHITCRDNQNQIYTVVNDEVISLDWFSQMPNMDSDGMQGVSIKYTLPNLKSHLATSTVGYLKIDAGQQKPLQVAKKHNILYKVDKGQAIVKLFERKRIADVGSTFYIPLGAEYTILNSSIENDLLLFFVKMSAP